MKRTLEKKKLKEEHKWSLRNLKREILRPYQIKIQRIGAFKSLEKIKEELEEGRIYDKTKGRFR